MYQQSYYHVVWDIHVSTKVINMCHGIYMYKHKLLTCGMEYTCINKVINMWHGTYMYKQKLLTCGIEYICINKSY